MPDKRPNFLLVMVEHFSPFADPNYADVPVKAPALTRLAETSVRFENAYCNSPVCGPSRMTFLTGRHVCNHGSYDNGSTLPCHVPTFAHMLTANGYQTAMCGRMHYHGLDTLKGFERRLVPEIHNPLMANPGDFPGPFEPIRPLPPAPAREGDYYPDFHEKPLWAHDGHVTDSAREFLLGHAGSGDDRPFCLTVGYCAVHPSMKRDPALKALYDYYIRLDDLPISHVTEEQYERLPEHIKRYHQYQGHTREMFSDEFQRFQMAWYLAHVTYMDGQVGRLLDSLDEAGLADDTVVLFTSDHGDGMGRHGVWGKMFFYEGASQVPLYIRVPGMRMGRVVKERVGLTDVLPTLAGLAGCEVRFPVDGKDLTPVLAESRPEEEGAAIFSEYHGYLSPSDAYMIIKGDSKYCHYLLEPGELYNLADDPAEENNLIDDPACAAIRADLEAEIRKRVDIERMKQLIEEYNLQRQACVEGMAASPSIRTFNLDFIAAHRAQFDAPFDDGGKHAAQWEPHLYGSV